MKPWRLRTNGTLPRHATARTVYAMHLSAMSIMFKFRHSQKELLESWSEQVLFEEDKNVRDLTVV